MAPEIHGDKLSIRCHLCGSLGLQVFYEVKDVPTSCNLLWKTKSEAINCPKGHLKLAFCPSCTLVSNIAIEPEKNQYGQLYDNSLFYSAHFQVFARQLTRTLIQRHNLYSKRIVEAGCGKVDFLSLFSELGQNIGSRFDSECTESNDLERTKNGSIGAVPVDFVLSYHELEHRNSPELYLQNLRKMFGQSSQTKFFFAVPNAIKAFEEGDFSDIIYEHVSYFTVPALSFIFAFCGYEISEIAESKNEIFDSIYLTATPKKTIDSTPQLSSKIETVQIEDCIKRFAAKSTSNTRRQSRMITHFLDEEKRVVIWGAGARGVTFLNTLKDSRIEFAVDINPHKQGMYVPGMGQKIVGPEFLADYQPDIVILANPAYKKEIKQTIVNLGVNARIVSI